VASDGWLCATWHNQTIGMWSIKPTKKNTSPLIMEHFLFTHIIKIFMIKLFSGSRRNKEFLKERKSNQIKSILSHYKVNFAQKENILKAQKC
jgi:hypothetical protein